MRLPLRRRSNHTKLTTSAFAFSSKDLADGQDVLAVLCVTLIRTALQQVSAAARTLITQLQRRIRFGLLMLLNLRPKCSLIKVIL